ncbi:MAG: AAA domain-containing protein [Desulfobacteraceae bacterium]|nr:AAA domain-containing protein [Desulfobacteraceae bacterium]
MDTNQIHLQNKLYRHLLTEDRQRDPDAFLSKLLKIFVLITGANQGYLELQDYQKNIFWSSLSYNVQEIKNIQNAISKGIIAAALEDRKVLQTISAICDPRFNLRQSVKAAKIEAVLCVPIYTGRIQGVIYLQGGKGFKADAREHTRDAEFIVAHITPLIEQIYSHKKLSKNRDHTAYLRKKHKIEGVVGASRALEEVLKTALMTAPLNINLLLTGETGTGKTQFAEMIHQNSLRKKGPFVPLNCAALPETLMENELFGSIPGGHSSATKSIQGKVAAAQDGTLFLDEIGELSISVQAKLLQLLQSGFYYPLGSSKPVKANIRIITATNLDLKKQIKQKRFREDLYYRINVFSIHLPALAERKTDIDILAKYFCKESCKKHGISELDISYSVLNSLSNKIWKGNVRQLMHTIEAAVIYATLENKKEISYHHMFPPGSSSEGVNENALNFKAATLSFQRQFLGKNLNIRDWNVSRTAKDLAISRSQLNNLIKTFKLKPNRLHQGVENNSSDFEKGEDIKETDELNL